MALLERTTANADRASGVDPSIFGTKTAKYIESLKAENVQLESELEHVKKVRDTLKGELAMQEMYRRLDCVRVAQKYLEAARHDSGNLIGTAANIAHFIENGASERDKGPDRAPLS